MKKLLMFLCCVLMINGAWAASETTCSESVLYLEGNQNIKDDEFLYSNELEYEKAKNGVKNSTARSGGGAMVYECDRSSRRSNCGNRSVVTLEAGHYYRGERVDRKETYTCWTNNAFHWNDKWVPGNSQCRIQDTSVPVGRSYEKTLTLAECADLRVSDPVRGVEFSAVCEESPVARCIAVKCIDGFKPNADGICDKVVQEQPQKSDAAKPAKPSVPSKPSEPVQPSVDTPVSPVVPNPVVPYVWSCPSTDSITVDASCTKAVSAKENLKEYCANDPTRNIDGYNQRIADIESANAECEQKQNALAGANLKAKIESRVKSMSGKLNDWQKSLSVWKTSEGNFNGARLASDSIAGVVLGTAGGLITSHVVKKNQVKSGFEDVQCTIGGQRVADWHDEFMVGIK